MSSVREDAVIGAAAAAARTRSSPRTAWDSGVILPSSDWQRRDEDQLVLYCRVFVAGHESTFVLQFAPAAGAVVSDDLLEHSAQSRRIDDLALADGNSAGGLVVVTSGDDPLGIRDNAAVVEEYVDMTLGREQRAN